MITYIVLAATVAALLSFIYIRDKEHASERRDLLDRIQAPTFAEYANKVIKEIKAEQPPAEVKVVEDYIS